MDSNRFYSNRLCISLCSYIEDSRISMVDCWYMQGERLSSFLCVRLCKTLFGKSILVQWKRICIDCSPKKKSKSKRFVSWWQVNFLPRSLSLLVRIGRTENAQHWELLTLADRICRWLTLPALDAIWVSHFQKCSLLLSRKPFECIRKSHRRRCTRCNHHCRSRLCRKLPMQKLQKVESSAKLWTVIWLEFWLALYVELNRVSRFRSVRNRETFLRSSSQVSYFNSHWATTKHNKLVIESIILDFVIILIKTYSSRTNKPAGIQCLLSRSWT